MSENDADVGLEVALAMNDLIVVRYAISAYFATSADVQIAYALEAGPFNEVRTRINEWRWRHDK